jgi:H+-translocating NAD(P) transhydrogenase subunit beta
VDSIVHILYLIAASLFILGLKNLSSARTARRGNFLAASGMFIAVVVTLFDRQIVEFQYIILGVIIGGTIGAILAKKVQITAMPQMVALLNGFGGGASALVAFSEYFWLPEIVGLHILITLILSLLIGTLTFFGSIIAFSKLQGLLRDAPVVFPLQKIFNALLLVAVVVLAVIFVLDPTLWWIPLIIVIIAAILGITSVLPIGGADMPVVISLLNSYSGVAAAMTGFVLSNNMLIIGGSLVGAAGLILTDLMCKAMNRSLPNVLFAAVGASAEQLKTMAARRSVTRYTPEDAITMLENANSVIIVPGYGLAVSQAQGVLHEMATLLMKNGAKVRYAIHPVAGRMPGHMNVLLAEANVPYDQLYEMDNINDDFKGTDVALVIGANDVVNPAARDKKDSILYGMPILNVDHAGTVMIVKRSLAPGFAGEDNELFYSDKTMMVFGDAKNVVTKIVQNLKDSIK